MFCRKCGNKLYDDDVFCPECGVKIEKERIETQKNIDASDGEPLHTEPEYRRTVNIDRALDSDKGLRACNIIINIHLFTVFILGIHLIVWFIALIVPGGLNWSDFGKSAKTALYIMGFCLIISHIVSMIAEPKEDRIIKKICPPISSLLVIDKDICKDKYSIRLSAWNFVINQYAPEYSYTYKLQSVFGLFEVIWWSFAFPPVFYTWMTSITSLGLGIKDILTILQLTLALPTTWIFLIQAIPLSLITSLSAKKQKKVIANLEDKWNAEIKKDLQNKLLHQLKNLQSENQFIEK